MILNNLLTKEGIKEFRAGIWHFPKEISYSINKAIQETPKPQFIALFYALYYLILQLIINDDPYTPKGCLCSNCKQRLVCVSKRETKGIVACAYWEKESITKESKL